MLLCNAYGLVCKRSQVFRRPRRMDALLFNFAGSSGEEGVSFCLFRRTASHTNHNHGELVEDVTDFTCQVTQEVRTA